MFNGYLIKVEDYEIPLEIMKIDGWDNYLEVLDADSYRDIDGGLHRIVLDHNCPVCKLTTIEGLNNDQVEAFMAQLRARWKKGREAKVTIYMSELNDYVIVDCYTPTIHFPAKKIDKVNRKIYYNSIEIQFISK